jgi:diaminopimelate epimerase
MQVQFSKMHGLGNDFVVIDNVSQNVFLSKEKIQKLADRNFGIGFDQLLMVEPPYAPDQDFHYRIFNADGSEVAQCGNGVRCFARFVHLKGLTNRHKLKVSTKSGQIMLYLERDGQVTVNMGIPQFEPAHIPLRVEELQTSYSVKVDDEEVVFGAVSMGNPHCVIETKNIADEQVEKIGRQLTQHECFPEGANIGFMQILGESHIKLRVYERGVRETLACGSGACAAVAIGQQHGKLNKDVKVELPGGVLKISWYGGSNQVKMTGPVQHVFDGYFNL